MKEANQFLKAGDVVQALSIYTEIEAENPENADVIFCIARCHLLLNNKQAAIPYLEKAIEFEFTQNIFHLQREAYKELGNLYYNEERFADALFCYENYKGRLLNKEASYKNDLQFAHERMKWSQAGVELAADPLRVFIDNIGDSINTEYPEYCSVINADISVMMFTSCRPDSINMHDEDEVYDEDIYLSQRRNGHWIGARRLGPPLNTPKNDGILGLSADGTTMFVFMTENGGDIGYSTLQGDVWSEKQNMGPAINSFAHETSASLSSDGKTFYFVSNRDNPKGINHDIYYSTKDSLGNWQPAVNIGAPVNTPEDEMAVFIHPNGSTMYFSSKGHNTIGGYDIFKTEFVNGEWTSPQNVGYPVNTIGDELFFTLSASERYGYYSSLREGGKGDYDIYRITFLDDAKQPTFVSEDKLVANQGTSISSSSKQKRKSTSAAVLLLKGTVTDAKTLQPIFSSIVVQNSVTNEQVTYFETDSLNGNYMIVLPTGQNYRLTFNAPKHLFYSENVNAARLTTYKEVERDVQLQRIAIGARVTLRNIFFESGTATLTQEAIDVLNTVIPLFKEEPDMHIEVSGHTDNTGSVAYNQRLSLERAKAVTKYLIESGIDATNLSAVGYGLTQPVDTNDTETGRANNRRIEFKITE
ncbi:hypothetical protein AGMMS4956_05460 [Bacteroidia bacterium]|nr:hypothetical protein AGMMS4956_05460 [Bacteroidia bacterium]